MRLLFWYCDRFAWHPSMKVLDNAPEAMPMTHEQAVVIFIHVEPPDVEEGSSAETKLVKNAKWLARKWETLKIILHSFTHLGEQKADPEAAKGLLDRVQMRLETAGYTAMQTPYGYFNEPFPRCAGASAGADLQGVLAGFMMASKENRFGPEYGSLDDESFIPKYQAACFCGSVRYEVSSDPVDAKICHCLACQQLHGAPMQWAAIFHKHHVRFIAGMKHLHFYNNEQDLHERILPCKVSCGKCGTPIADEGRRMWLAFPTLFDFGPTAEVPDAFKPTCHIFYGMRVVDVRDDLPKWSGHKNHSTRL